MTKVHNTPWEIKVPNGRYKVRVVNGICGHILFDSPYALLIEGVLAFDELPERSFWIEAIKEVDVKDGKLTLSLPEERSAYVNFVEISLLESSERKVN